MSGTNVSSNGLNLFINGAGADANVVAFFGSANNTAGDAMHVRSLGGSIDVDLTNTILVGNLAGNAALKAEVPLGAGNIDITMTNGAADGLNGAAGISTTAQTGTTTIILNNGFVFGTLAGISATSTTGAIVIQNLGGTVQTGGFSSSPAIITSGGPTAITNTGTIRGTVTTGASNDVFTQNGLWITEGLSDFGAGADALTNNGTIVVGDDPGIVEATTFGNLETFTNNGTIDLSDQVAGDGTTSFDTLTVSGNYIGNGGSLLVDAFLEGPGSQADRLIVGGNTSGSTSIGVVNTSPGVGAYNPDGIVIVQVTGSSNVSDFTLAGGPINTGLFIYELVFDAANKTFELVSKPSGALELGGLESGAQTVWYETAEAWQGRQADLASAACAWQKDLHDKPRPVACPDRIGGVWLKALGSWTDFDLRYMQRIGGLVGGIDRGFEVGEDGNLLVGLLGGYVHSLQDFKASPSTSDLTGGVIGGYASYRQGAFSLHGLVKADILDMDYSNPALGANGEASADAFSLGAKIDAAYRIGGQTGTFFEPLVSAAIVSGHIDDFALGTVIANPGNNDSLRAGIGAKLGTKMDMGNIMVETSLTGRVWNEFEATNTIHIGTTGQPLDLVDSGYHGLFGEVNGALNVAFMESGTSFFIKTDLKFNDNATTAGINGGLRVTW